MYKKGQIFRNIYKNRGFLSDTYLDSEILIKTTRMGRTYMSAAMILTGMYPPRSYQRWSDFETIWQPIPIYSDSPDHTPVCKLYKYQLALNITLTRTICNSVLSSQQIVIPDLKI